MFFCKADPLALAVAEQLVYQWPDGNLPWTIMDELPRVNFADLQNAATAGFNWWTSYCGLKPQYVTSARDARLLIYTAAIDGAGGVLADCQLPTPGMKQVHMRLDLGEDWDAALTPTQRRINLAFVISHEGGHGIGMGHAPGGSKNRMAPVYDPSIIKAGSWDQTESQRRYGQASAPPTPPPTTPTTPTTPTVPTTPGGGFSMINLLLKLAPIISWFIQNKDQLAPLLDALKKIFEASQLLPAKLVTEQLVDKSTFRTLAVQWATTLQTTAAATVWPWDDAAAALLLEAVKTDWLMDMLYAVLSGQMHISDQMLQAALHGDDNGLIMAMRSVN